MVRRVGAPLALAAAVALALAACAPSSPTDGGGGSKSGSAATASFSGSESGKVAMNLCDSSGAYSIFVTVDGSSDKLAGVVSSSTMTFTGEDSIYTIDKSGPLPSVSSDGNSVTLNGVILKSVLDSTKTVTFAGKITCP
jgi:hypothetical protein